MWNNYFGGIQKKYSLSVSFKKPLVIRLDGKDVTKNRDNDFFNDSANTFLFNFKKSVKFFSQKYRCLAICGSDEVSFIFLNPSILINDTDKDKYNCTNEIISVFSQYFYDFFNELGYQKIFWHGKCFSIEEKKVKSYLKYRSSIIKNVLTTAFLIMHKDYISNESMNSKIEKCKKYDDYKNVEPIIEGVLFFDGDEIDLKEYFNDRIVKVKGQDITEDGAFNNLFDNNGTIFVD